MKWDELRDRLSDLNLTQEQFIGVLDLIAEGVGVEVEPTAFKAKLGSVELDTFDKERGHNYCPRKCDLTVKVDGKVQLNIKSLEIPKLEADSVEALTLNMEFYPYTPSLLFSDE